MRVASLTFLGVFAVAAAGGGGAAAACSCPKEYMIKKYGSVRAIDQLPPNPPIEAAPPAEPAPKADTATEAAEDGPAEPLDRVVGKGYSSDPKLQ